MLTLLLKLLGLAVAAVGAAIALLGETTHERRLTVRGKVAVSVLVVGFALSVAVELGGIYTSRVSERWEVVKTLPITEVVYSFLLREAGTAEALVSTLNNLIIVYGIRPGNANHLTGIVVKWSHDPSQPNAQDATKLVLTSGGDIRATTRVDLYRLVADGWLSSVKDDWTSDDYKRSIGGVKTRLSWLDHGMTSDIREVLHLGRLYSLALRVNAKADLDNLQQATITFYTAGNSAMTVDLKALKWSPVIGDRKDPTPAYFHATLDGEDLVDMWRDQTHP